MSPADDKDAVNPAKQGTKVSAHYTVTLQPGSSTTVRTRLWQKDEAPQGDDGTAYVFGEAFAATMEQRRQEADVFYKKVRSIRNLSKCHQIEIRLIPFVPSVYVIYIYMLYIYKLISELFTQRRNIKHKEKRLL